MPDTHKRVYIHIYIHVFTCVRTEQLPGKLGSECLGLALYSCSAAAESLPAADDVQFSSVFVFCSVVSHVFEHLGRFCTDFFFLSFVPPRGFSQHLKTPKPRGLGTKFAPSKISNFNVCVCCKPASLCLKCCPSFHELCASLQSFSVSETPLPIPSDENKSRCCFTALVRTILPPSQLLPPVPPVRTSQPSPQRLPTAQLTLSAQEGANTTACDIQQLRKSLH